MEPFYFCIATPLLLHGNKKIKIKTARTAVKLNNRRKENPTGGVHSSKDKRVYAVPFASDPSFLNLSTLKI